MDDRNVKNDSPMIRGFFDTILVDGSNAAFDMTCESLCRNDEDEVTKILRKKNKSNEMLRK